MHPVGCYLKLHEAMLMRAEQTWLLVTNMLLWQRKKNIKCAFGMGHGKHKVFLSSRYIHSKKESG